MDFDAAVLHEPGAELSLERLRLLELGRTDVLVRVRASGLCHTDLEVIDGSWPRPTPIVLGHEVAGVVEEVGPDVTLITPGEHMVCSWNPTCGHCFWCDGNQPILCAAHRQAELDGRLIDGATRLRLGRAEVYHFMHVAGFAEYCVVDETSAVRVPADIPFDRACLIGCGVMTGVGAVTRVARVSLGSTVAVFGAGAVGLNVVQGARLARAAIIVAADFDSGRRDLARTVGATHALDPHGDDTLAAIQDVTDGRGVDFAFEAAGSEQALRLTLESVRPGGTVVILGKTNVDAEVSLRFGSLMGDKRITRSSYGGARPREDFPMLARVYLEGELYLDELIGARIGLSDINLGIDSVREGRDVRSIVTF